MIAFLLSPAGRKVAGALAALALLLAAYAYIDHRGYTRAEAHYKGILAAEHAAAITARDAEIERQAAANNAAKAREAARIAEMQTQAEQLAKQIEELQREASQDPDAGRTALGAPSVQRINKVR
ncbi:putative endopeptidase protein [Rhizobium phage RHph_Y3_56_1]|nr:putative endopeptidase protein [Rhizobium phage RHph_Y3_1]QIG78003.1 putative endopeptidase protein [Rhizobium phage RHph_Y3_56_1]